MELTAAQPATRAAEASAIAMELAGMKFSRPLTHEARQVEVRERHVLGTVEVSEQPLAVAVDGADQHPLGVGEVDEAEVALRISSARHD